MIMFATLTSPTPGDMAAFLGCLFFLVAGANQVMKFLDRNKDKPPASDVRAELVEKFTPKDVFHAHVAQNLREHENMFSKLGGVERGATARMDALSKEWRAFVDAKFSEMATADNSGREKLHDRINEILSEVSELRGEIRAKRTGQ